MRSAREIRFRLAQQLENARLYLFTPALPRAPQVAELPLPDSRVAARALCGSSFAEQVESIGREVIRHRFRLFSNTIETGPNIEWRKDYIHGRVTGTDYFRFIPYLDFEKAGDHKNIWELNRHQHLVLLAQAWLFTKDRAFLDELEAELKTWFEQNPFLRGINYTSALEVAFRALSWLWIDHMVGPQLSPQMRLQLLNGMFQHGHFLKANLSTYFSPNTHLLGEGVALFALGLKFPKSGWAPLGAKVVEEERDRQIQADGSHFEQSSYYHVYALDFFLFYYILAKRPAALEPSLRKMASFLASVHGPAAMLNFFGDDDGGRLFHPYGDRAIFGRATLTTCAVLFPDEGLSLDADSAAEQANWWVGSANPTVLHDTSDYATEFADSGLISIARGDLHLLIDAGPFGPGGAGHSHSDTLSFTIRSGQQELLIDPGTYTYVADPKARDEFRGSGYHNTIRIDGKDQADPSGPFRWVKKPQVIRDAFLEKGDTVYLDATCHYRDISHRRRFFLVGKRVLFVVDNLVGPEGMRSVEEFWHLGAGASDSMVVLSDAPAQAEQVKGWRSRCLGTKEKSPVIAYRWQGLFPMATTTVFLFGSVEFNGLLKTSYEADAVVIRVPGVEGVEFPMTGPPHVLPA